MCEGCGCWYLWMNRGRMCFEEEHPTKQNLGFGLLAGSSSSRLSAGRDGLEVRERGLDCMLNTAAAALLFHAAVCCAFWWLQGLWPWQGEGEALLLCQSCCTWALLCWWCTHCAVMRGQPIPIAPLLPGRRLSDTGLCCYLTCLTPRTPHPQTCNPTTPENASPTPCC